MGLPAIVDLLVVAGGRFRSAWTWGNAAGPFNLTGVRFLMQIRPTADDSQPPIFTLDSAANNGTIIVVALLGQFVLFIPAAATALFTFSSPAFYQLFAHYPSDPSNPVCLWQGQVYLTNQVTQPS